MHLRFAKYIFSIPPVEPDVLRHGQTQQEEFEQD